MGFPVTSLASAQVYVCPYPALEDLCRRGLLAPFSVPATPSLSSAGVFPLGSQCGRTAHRPCRGQMTLSPELSSLANSTFLLPASASPPSHTGMLLGLCPSATALNQRSEKMALRDTGDEQETSSRHCPTRVPRDPSWRLLPRTMAVVLGPPAQAPFLPWL